MESSVLGLGHGIAVFEIGKILDPLSIVSLAVLSVRAVDFARFAHYKL